MNEADHVPVLLQEVLVALAPRAGDVSVDCTAGLGGHAAAVASRMGTGRVVLLDADPAMLARAEARVREVAPGCDVIARRANFAEVERVVGELGLRANTVLADLGFCSAQMADGARGFSFMREGPLDLRLDPGLATTAADLVNTLPERELASIFRDLGEEPRASVVARKIAEVRRESPILTTDRLAELIRTVVPRTSAGIDPATRAFQALRIAVNDELGVLDALLASLNRGAKAKEGWLAPGARVGIISFHSLEDRPVKAALGEMVRAGRAEVIGAKLVEADEDERRRNPRARSAKLRAVRLGESSLQT